MKSITSDTSRIERFIAANTGVISKKFGSVIEDDFDTNVGSEKELSLEQKLELAITKKISTHQNTIQISAICKNIGREIDLFEDERFREDEIAIIKLAEFERGRVIRLREGGFSFCDIAERFGRSVSTVQDCWEHWSWDGTASRRPGSMQPRGTTKREDRRIQCTTVVHLTTSAAEI
ncbi:transposable element Tc1 transposase [Trichonephila clavipes]|uniref:Transposable element Tc1 transposase n=1 Tax=Trichonephila clavipes TaxID=2585209 RepID=A0A8X6VWJ5_TRICX|nr:transposable element Tc1 transposase [Trichonephila clavipes]